MAIVSTIRRHARRLKGKFNSLAARLILAAGIWLSLGLAAGAFVLSEAFSVAMADNFDTALQVDLDGLVAAAEPGPGGTVILQERFLNRRFARVYSGLYWQIDPDAAGVRTNASHSLFDRTIRFEARDSHNGQSWGFAEGPDGQHLRVLARRVTLNAETGPLAYTFLVAGDMSGVDAAVANFNELVTRAFIVLGGGLILAIFVQVRVGLQPLRRVGEALARIRSGAARKLEGAFPAEIAPLASELNSLIEHSAEVVGRARTHVANLAHFFKTPLSVLASEADAQPGPLADAVRRQIDIMRRQVDHYLIRARSAGALDVLGNRTEVAPVLEALARALARIHQGRHLDIAVDCPAGLFFRGERQDFEEMAGNLMDNGCKWGRTQVRASAEGEHAWVVLRIEDDGPGLSPEDRLTALERGARLDESVPGTGLGLSIVRDIAKLYGGEMVLKDGSLGGLCAELRLPLVANHLLTTSS